MKRVLIITYYWPPSGGSGVQRWLKMSKYLPENGWQPVIYTADGAEYPVEDASLEKDVAPEAEIIRKSIIEPYTFYKKFLGIKKGEKVKAGFINEGDKKSGWKENLSIWVRGNLFIPDARCWWIRPSVKFLSRYLKEHPVDAIISTGPPHSMHLIAKMLHKKLGIPWVADFRDPWTDIDFYRDLKLTRFGDRKHHRLEYQVLTEATRVVTVGWDWAKGLERHGAKDVVVITNGYDETMQDMADCKNIAELTDSEKDKFILSHLGIVGATRNAVAFWEAISELLKMDDNGSDVVKDLHKRLKIKLIGQVDASVIETLKKNHIDDVVEIIPYIPHDTVLNEQMKSHLLLLFINNSPNAKGILTGKIFEYMAAGRPIFAIGPEDGDTAVMLEKTQSGVIAGFDDKEKIKSLIIQFYKQYKENQLVVKRNNLVDKFSRRSLAKDYADLLSNLLQ